MNQIKPPFPLKPCSALICLLMLAAPLAMADTETTSASSADKAEATKKTDSKVTTKAKVDADQVLPTVNVKGEVDTAIKPKIKTEQEKFKLPNTVASITTKELEENVNMTTTEDSVKYMPSLVVRKRYIGDTNAPLATRTTGTNSSARTMIYADGVLLSTFLGNNNTNTGSPRWNTVSPSEIERVDFLYGPYSAAYAGNSMGGVLNITTKMPTKFEFGADTQGSISDYNVFNNQGTAYSQKYAMYAGDKYKDLSFRFDYSHLLSDSMPISFMTGTPAAQTATIAGAVPVTGALSTKNGTNAPVEVYGAGQISRTEQDNFKWKLAYDITPTLRAAYTLGLWQNTMNWGTQSFLKDANGNSVVSGPVKINGRDYALGSGFSPTLIDQTTWSHGMSVKSDTGGKFDWELNGSLVELGTDTQRVSTLDPNASAKAIGGGAGRTTVLTGSNWNTADAKGIWRPGNFYGNHEVSFGFHNDSYQLVNPTYTTSSWQSGGNTGVYSDSEGKTRTQAYWAQDTWDFAKQWNFTLGGRLEDWNAFSGLNSSIVNNRLTSIYQTDKSSVDFSPKGKLTWTPQDSLRFGISMGQTDTFGLELAGNAKDVFVDKLNFYASGTWADSTITDNKASDAALNAQTATQKSAALLTNPGALNPSTGMMQPRVPTWRSTL